MSDNVAAVYLVARVFTCAIWMGTGLYKAFHFRLTKVEMVEHRVPWPEFSLPVVIAVEVLGSVLVIADLWVWLVCLGWVLYLFPATYFYHRHVVTADWGINFPDYAMTLKNASLLGGLLALMLLDPSRPAWLLGR